MHGSTPCAAYSATAQRHKEAIALFDYDAELARYHKRLWEALDIQPAIMSSTSAAVPARPPAYCARYRHLGPDAGAGPPTG